MPKHRPWAKDIEQDLGQMMAMGIEVKFFRKYAVPGNEEPSEDLKAFNVSHFTSIFGFLLMLYVLALIAFCIEITVNLVALK